MANGRSVTFKDAEKAKLRAIVGDRNLDPKLAVAWAEDGSFQIGELAPTIGPQQISEFLRSFFGQRAHRRFKARPAQTGGAKGTERSF